jgi:hypothetical protein
MFKSKDREPTFKNAESHCECAPAGEVVLEVDDSGRRKKKVGHTPDFIFLVYLARHGGACVNITGARSSYLRGNDTFKMPFPTASLLAPH